MQVFDEIEYVCQPNDTFKSISEKFFMGTPKYAGALQRHNQNDGRVSEQMQKNGTLTPGEKIYVPQAYILEERYADAIEKSTSPSSSPTMPAKYVPGTSPPPASPPSPPPAPSDPPPMPNP